MVTVSREANLILGAHGRTKPGPGSWLGLALLIATLLLALQFRGSIMEELVRRERVTDSSDLAAISQGILVAAMVVGALGSLLAWRIWCTLSLVGTTTLGMPDLAALGAKGLRTAAPRALAIAARLALLALTMLRNLLTRVFHLLKSVAAAVVSPLGAAVRSVAGLVLNSARYLRKFAWLILSLAMTPIFLLASGRCVSGG